MVKQALQQKTELSAHHVRMARAGLQLGVRELAILCNVNKATIVRLEAGHAVRKSTLAVVKETLTGLGVEFWVCEKRGKLIMSL